MKKKRLRTRELKENILRLHLEGDRTILSGCGLRIILRPVWSAIPVPRTCFSKL